MSRGGSAVKRHVFAVAGIGVALVLVVVAAMAIGGSGRPNAATAGRSGAPTGRVPVFVAATRPAAATAAPTSTATPVTPASSPTPAPSPAPCRADDLTIRVDGWSLSYGSRIISVALHNAGPRTCAANSTYRLMLIDGRAVRLALSAREQLNRVQLIPAGQAVTGLVDWSSWCGRRAAPTGLALLLRDGDDEVAITAELPSGFPVPDCADDGTTAIAPFVGVYQYAGESPFFYEFGRVSLSADKRTLTVDFRVESSTCPDEYEAAILARGDALLIGVFGARERPRPRGYPDRCPSSLAAELDATLAVPFRGSKVYDRGSPGVHFVRPPKPLAQLTGLPAGWELRSEGGHIAGAGTWGQVYSPLARPPAFGRGQVTLEYTFDPPLPADPADLGRAVTVNGAPARLAHDRDTGDLYLSWRVDSDLLRLSAHDSDFSEEELIKLAESAVAPAP